ncbi:MAG: hypothetical protein HKN13_05360 [Rhodothermales bacterium]|nr:hypothetical protein [Rhodothermales bacterium]
MEDTDMEEIDARILRATLELFADPDRADSAFITAEEICEQAKVDQSDFLDRFQGAGQVLSLSYFLLLDQAESEVRSLPGFELLALEERLASYVFVLLDVFEQNRAFVNRTFDERAAGLFSPFQQGLREALSNLFQATDVSSTNRILFDNAPVRLALSESIVQVVNKWVEDDSENRERSTALVDRVVALWAELLTTGIPDRSVELFRYAVESGYLPIDQLPIVKDWLGRSQD